MNCKKKALEMLAQDFKANPILLDLIRNWDYICDSKISSPKRISTVNQEVVLYIHVKPYALFEIDSSDIHRKINNFLYNYKISKIHIISSIY